MRKFATPELAERYAVANGGFAYAAADGAGWWTPGTHEFIELAEAMGLTLFG